MANSDLVSIEAVRQKLTEAYDELSTIEQLLVQLFSVIYEPVNRTSLLLCLNRINVTDKQGNAFTNLSLKPYLDGLLSKGVLIQNSGEGPQCHPFLTEIATRHAVIFGRFEPFVKEIKIVLPLPTRWKNGPRYFRNERQFLREFRIELYRQDITSLQQLVKDYYATSYPAEKLSIEEIYEQIGNNPFDPAWIRTLSPELAEAILSSVLNVSMLKLTPAPEALQLLQEACAKPESSDFLRILRIEQGMLRGQFAEAQRMLEQLAKHYGSRASNLQGWLLFLRGENEKAIAAYTDALQAMKKGTGKRKIYFQSISGLFFILALIKQGGADRLREAEEYIRTAIQAKHWLSPTYSVLEYLLKLQQGDLAAKPILVNTAPRPGQQSLEFLIRALCLYWSDADQAKARLPKVLAEFYKNAGAAGYTWLAMETAELAARFKSSSPSSRQALEFRRTQGILTLVDLLQPRETWELCLTALTSLSKDTSATTTTKPASDLRLAWFITLYGNHNYSLEPREQKFSVKGEWSKGRPIALKRLKKAGELDYLTSQDLRVCAELESDYGYYGQTNYSFGEKAIAALVGHPYVFWADAPTTPIEIVKGEPELLVTKGKGDRLTLQFSPTIESDSSMLTVKESPTRLKVIEVTPDHRRIAEILGKQNRLEVPAAAKDRVLEAIHAVSSLVTIHSDIGGGVAAEEVPADPKPHVHLLPAGEGLKVAVLTRPFAQGGPYYRPGAGGETVIAEIDGKRLQTTRNLKQEKQLATTAIAALPTLTNQEEEDGEWLVSDPEDCLELLLELQNVGDTAVMEWPQGEKLRVSHHAGLKDFRMAIKQQNDWFATEGTLQLDDRLVLDMQQLMALLDQTSSRFVPLGDGQFLALTQEFRKRLDDLRSLSEKSGKGLRMHPLAALSLEEWVDDVGQLKADKHWKQHIQRLKDVQDYDPQLPSTLQADLRDYQVEGFRWLARLAYWGVGACLADDMGLGKTLQALAVILTRAADGPTLIIAPTSVCMNWIAEAERFAPTLNVIQLGSGETSGDRQGQRQKLLDALQPFDMLVCSYGLLQQEEVAEMLAKVQWQTIVLDEAQSIKNFATKRSQAAMNLQGGFKLITTGTPIENHLGELWNLFRFINPGLLGSLDHFNQRFANPIERYQDKPARQRLKTLIQPFLLRRTKSQVLQELPSRTEILLQVELSREEQAFYEALRRDAIARLSESDATAGAKHLQVLAEIMKLRRSCCNTRLVKPDIALPSSKLQLFGEVVTELLENRHKALVFSQFVDHLHILRAYLDDQQIKYQYLDGSTPGSDRQKRVNAFQAGEGDVFLISLKAGGTGLNLTAADYVIHMDPWWNPAVEDQASDRAHRIGQQRPVTIYRLVAKGTIEEKIVEMHQHKRDLADSLLEGADVSGKVSTDELLRLISEG